MGFWTHTTQLRTAEIIFTILLFTRITGAAVRPVVIFTPTWSKILKGDSVTMTCDVGISEQENVTYTWHRDNRQIRTGKTFTIQSAQYYYSHGGNYQCSTSEENISDGVTLQVSSGPVILQSPPYIYEGDNLSLRCHSGSKISGRPIVFYKNNETISSSTAESEILVVNHTDPTAVYKCTRQIWSTGYSIHHDETNFSAQGAAASFMVTFFPNWRKIFTGENVKMTCSGNPDGQYYWYKDNRLLVETNQNFIEINSAQGNDSGIYECGSRSDRSPAVSLDVSDGPVILQAPLVYDRYNRYLRCRSHPEYSVQWTRFYKDGKLLDRSGDEQHYLRGPDVSGRYRCEKVLRGNYKSYTDSVSVPIRELFSSPDIRLTPSTLTEDDNMTLPVLTEGDNRTLPVLTEADSMVLICDTKLSPHRRTTDLQFAFYRDGREVQGFSSSNKYEATAVQLKDSGNYTCKGRTLKSRIEKMSQELQVQIYKMDTGTHCGYLYRTISIALLLILITPAFLIFRYRHNMNRLFCKRNQTGDSQPGTDKTFAEEEVISYMEGSRSLEDDLLQSNSVTVYQEISASVDVPEADDVYYTTIRFPPKALSLTVADMVIYSTVRINDSDT